MTETIVDRLHIAAKSCDFMNLPHNAGTCREAIDEVERLTAENKQVRKDLMEAIDAARKLQDDMVLRADIGTYDGDHSVQAGYTVWSNFCVALAKLEKVDSE